MMKNKLLWINNTDPNSYTEQQIQFWKKVILKEKDIKLKKKWIKITIQKINKQLELLNKNNREKNIYKYKKLKSNLENYLKNIK